VPYGTPGFGALAMRDVQSGTKCTGAALTFADAGDQKYVSLTGRATVSNDRQKIKESLVDAS
jgi:general stress protein 26